MPFECPECASRKARSSPPYNLGEWLLRRLGWHYLRCLDCDERYRRHILLPDSFIYAKCPRCYRMDLSTWEQHHYRTSTFTRLKLALGARRMRCEVCRCNFASFRKRKKWYRRQETAPAVASEPHGASSEP